MTFPKDSIQLSLMTQGPFALHLSASDVPQRIPYIFPLKVLGFKRLGVLRWTERTLPDREKSPKSDTLDNPRRPPVQSSQLAMLTEWYYPLPKTCGFPQTPTCLQNQTQSWTTKVLHLSSDPCPTTSPYTSISHKSILRSHTCHFETACSSMCSLLYVCPCVSLPSFPTLSYFLTRLIPKHLLNCVTSLHCTLPSQKFKDPPTWSPYGHCDPATVYSA